METARFWIDDSEPGGLEPGGAGRATAMRVRIMHVFLRRRLLAHPDWDLAAWGVPISQSDALITLMSSSLTPGLAMHLMGYRTSIREIEAMMHYWRYIGHLLGVQPRWYPETVKQGLQLSTVFLLKCARTAGADGVELVESYPRAFTPKGGTPWRKRLRDEINYRAQLGYTRHFLPGRFYRSYDMPNAWPWALHPLLQAPALLLDAFKVGEVRLLVVVHEHEVKRFVCEAELVPQPLDRRAAVPERAHEDRQPVLHARVSPNPAGDLGIRRVELDRAEPGIGRHHPCDPQPGVAAVGAELEQQSRRGPFDRPVEDLTLLVADVHHHAACRAEVIDDADRLVQVSRAGMGENMRG